MSEDVFSKQLEMAQKRGLYLDPRIVRKEVDGIYGLFAIDDISKGTKLISYPVVKCVQPFEDDAYTSETSKAIKNIHKAVLEFAKGEASEYYCHFMQFETLEYFEENSTYYYSDEELEVIRSMNPILLECILEVNFITKSRINAVKALEPNLDSDLIVRVCLNYASRGWDDSGFVPIIDYVNHSDRLGNVRGVNAEEYFLTAKVDYKKDDQIYISYSRKDMYFHCIHYNYFDPGGVHNIGYGARLSQIASSQFDKEVMRYTATLFPLKVGQVNNDFHYRCADSDVCFLESAPSLKLLAYLESNYFPSQAEWQLKKCTALSLLGRLLTVLNFLLRENKVDQFQLEDIPEKLHRFFFMLKKEKQMLLSNKEWVTDNLYL